jgi:hypothetical protein
MLKQMVAVEYEEAKTDPRLRMGSSFYKHLDLSFGGFPIHAQTVWYSHGTHTEKMTGGKIVMTEHLVLNSTLPRGSGKSIPWFLVFSINRSGNAEDKIHKLEDAQYTSGNIQWIVRGQDYSHELMYKDGPVAFRSPKGNLSLTSRNCYTMAVLREVWDEAMAEGFIPFDRKKSDNGAEMAKIIDKQIMTMFALHLKSQLDAIADVWNDKTSRTDDLPSYHYYIHGTHESRYDIFA